MRDSVEGTTFSEQRWAEKVKERVTVCYRRGGKGGRVGETDLKRKKADLWFVSHDRLAGCSFVSSRWQRDQR